MVVPVKAFREAKHRLAPVFSPEERIVLAHRLGETVIAAAGDAPVHVVCDDDEVADWAIENGAKVLFTPGLGLSGAVTAGVAHLGAEGAEMVTVAHADLPLAYGLEAFGADGEVTLAPDRRLDGTNVATVPARSGFRFAYGPGSFTRHRAEAERLGLVCHAIHDWRLASDIDTPEDLETLHEQCGYDPFPNIASEEGPR